MTVSCNVPCLCLLQGLLKECNELGAEYLFQKDKPYDVSYDTGDKTIQCGRHVDAFKLWLMWKGKVCKHSVTLTKIRSLFFPLIMTLNQTESNLSNLFFLQLNYRLRWGLRA